jgi:hypothetical protein
VDLEQALTNVRHRLDGNAEKTPVRFHRVGELTVAAPVACQGPTPGGAVAESEAVPHGAHAAWAAYVTHETAPEPAGPHQPRPFRSSVLMVALVMAGREADEIDAADYFEPADDVGSVGEEAVWLCDESAWRGIDAQTAARVLAELRAADADPDSVPPNAVSTLIRADTGSNLIAVPCDLVSTRLYEGFDEEGGLVAVVWTMVE